MDRPVEYDRGAVASLLLVGTLVLAPVALVLGVRGLRRTGPGRRRGRWCAVLGVVGGGLGIVAMIGGLWLGSWFRDNVRPVDDLAVGDCVSPGFDLDDLATEDVAFGSRSCSGAHLAEVAVTGTLDYSQAESFALRSGAEICANRYAEPYLSAAESARYDVLVVLDGDPDRASYGDTYACLLLRADGTSLHEPIGGRGA